MTPRGLPCDLLRPGLLAERPTGATKKPDRFRAGCDAKQSKPFPETWDPMDPYNRKYTIFWGNDQRCIDFFRWRGHRKKEFCNGIVAVRLQGLSPTAPHIMINEEFHASWGRRNTRSAAPNSAA